MKFAMNIMPLQSEPLWSNLTCWDQEYCYDCNSVFINCLSRVRKQWQIH